MKIILASLLLFFSLDLLADFGRKYQGNGSVHFQRNSLGCEIQNNVSDTGRVHKIVFDMVCQDRYTGQRFNSTKLVRCGIDYDHCDIEGYDFEIFNSGLLRRSCDFVERARCRFTYSFLVPEDPDYP